MIRFVRAPGQVEVDWPLLHHHAFFFGDLNYRLAMDPRAVLDATAVASASKSWDTLHAADELRREMASRGVFEGGPTFQYLPAGSSSVAGGQRW